MSWSAPDIHTLYDTLDATWPAAKFDQISGWIIRDGQGGGKRVSAATIIDPTAQINTAESAMVALGQDKLFMIKDGDQDLDKALNNAGYNIIDPVVLLASKLQANSEHFPETQTNATNEMASIWQQGGIGSDRIAVMYRAARPKYFCCLEGHAVAFSAIHNGICMTHAVEVLSSARRQGLGRRIMEKIEHWALANGAHTLSVITVLENSAALQLYRSLGMQTIGYYHYRIKA